MAWVEENEVAGQEAYRVDRLEAHRRLDTLPKSDVEVDGHEPVLPGVSEFQRDGRKDLEDQYGSRVDAERVKGQNG